MNGCFTKGCLGSLLLAIALAITLVVTCPKPQAHREAINEVMGEAIRAKLGSSSDLIGQAVSVIGGSVLSKASEIAIDRMVHVDNYYVVSIGRIRWNGKDRIVSVGILGQVITPSKEDVLKEVSRHGL